MTDKTQASRYPPEAPPDDYCATQTPRAYERGEATKRREAPQHESSRQDIPTATIETLARSFFRESARYGFKQLDYVRFVNLLLDMATNGSVDAPVVRRRTPVSDRNAGNGNAASGLPLQGEQIRIRPFGHGDLSLFGRWLSDLHGRHFLLSRATSRQSDIRDVVGRSSAIIGIVTLLDQTPVGAIAYLDHDPVQRKAELRKLIGEPNWRGKGLAKEASRLWLEYGLTRLRLRKVYLSTLDTHLQNIRLNEELGFQVEGILRNEVLFDGLYHDVLRMGLWNDI